MLVKENICFDVYSSEFPNADVHQVEVVLRDGGSRFDIHEEDGESTVVQCKIFLNRLDVSRKNQIRESFKIAIENNQMDNWILCVPMVFHIMSLDGGNHGKRNKKTQELKFSYMMLIS